MIHANGCEKLMIHFYLANSRTKNRVIVVVRYITEWRKEEGYLYV